MSHLEPMIMDLALILMCAGAMTLLFKWMKQPLVLGYIVAGILAGPHLSITPTVVDTENVKMWSDIGVIFLLFALGLEFSFKKIFKMGSATIIAAVTIVMGMIVVGVTVGSMCGWSRMDCLFLGGMVAMSSTTIIFKAYTDMDLRSKPFAQLVLSILILEDIIAIVLMVILSTLAVSDNVEGIQLFGAMSKMAFFILLWFIVGIFVIPLLLRKVRHLMSDETMLIVSLGLCFSMVVTAASVDFSPAFGAFVMGSIMAETLEAERIHKLVNPVKDLFGAIFFVSVGMMVDPLMIAKYWLPILIIIAGIVVGQLVFGTLGVILTGKGLKVALQSSFSLTQIGEFAFIIAGLGTSLGVTSDFLYPVVVAVSVITTFITPYMIRLALPTYDFLTRFLPARVIKALAPKEVAISSRETQHWHYLLKRMCTKVVIYVIVIVATNTIMAEFLAPHVYEFIPGVWGRVICSLLLLAVITPFLRAIVMTQNRSVAFLTLWVIGGLHKVKLVATVAIRFMLALYLAMSAVWLFFQWSIIVILAIAVVLIVIAIMGKDMKQQTDYFERIFLHNLNERDEYKG
ncbi:MAG: cation:proton antiporter [Bacteroidales bacterium]|nr:cation:proton antiporter [Bacteroidales bacterium]